jgi:hypothetical protein
MYRRVLALFGDDHRRFVVGGPLGLSLHLGQLIDGELEVYLDPSDAPDALASVEGAGLKVEANEPHGKARITYGEHHATVRWTLPTPLFGKIDAAWFDHARRTRFLGLRVRVAPVEELLWLRIAVPNAASVGDPLIGQLLLARGEHLDWGRLLMRMVGLEALLLSHLFLFWHQYPESARLVLPAWVVTTLRARLDQSERAGGGTSMGMADVSVLDPTRIEESLAEESLHGGRL